MSTRSHIGLQNPDGTISAIYCHFDGYIQGGVGQKLVENLTEPEEIKKFLQQGDRSSFSAPYTDCENTGSVTYDCMEDWLSNEKEEYMYLFRKGEWYYVYRYGRDPYTWKLVKKYL